MGRTLWDTKQPECPLLDCVKIGANGLWSVANCDERTNFTCIKGRFFNSLFFCMVVSIGLPVRLQLEGKCFDS